MAELLRRYRVEKSRVREALIRAGVPNSQLRGRSLREMQDLLWRGVTSAAP
jgi:hypothetical protein